MPIVVALSKITAQAFNRSIELALRSPPDKDASLDRIRRAIGNLPEGKLYTSNQGREVTFYTMIDGHQKYMPKKSPATHSLARKTYLMLLQEILELTESNRPADVLRRKALIAKLQKLISAYERGNLDLARIILTSQQHRWFAGKFVQKSINKAKAAQASCGLFVRSNAEKDIVNAAESLAVPLHYEEQQIIKVHSLVKKLEDDLRRRGLLHGQVYDYFEGNIHWNVPPELEWMNARGSVWMSYYPARGTIIIFNDFRIMFADGTIFIWEHEGMMGDFFYRCHATERASVMKITNTVNKENLLETYQEDIDSPEKLKDIIEKYVLPRLWF